MSDDSPVTGALFRRNYFREPTLLADSQRARRRLFMAFDRTTTDNSKGSFATAVMARLGVDYPAGGWGFLHNEFWMNGDISDVLSAVTIWLRMVGLTTANIGVVRGIMQEEQLRYRVDDQGGVHFLVDEEFERGVASAIAGLGEPKFAAARHALEEGLGGLRVASQSGKRLIRGIFEAVESAFLIVISQPAVDRISGEAIDQYFRPILLQRYADWADAEEITDRMLRVLKAWVKVGHYYRHGSPLEQIHEPPIDLALLVAAEGMSMLRYIIAG